MFCEEIAREAPFCWSAQGGGTDPWETGSYDLALEEAHIEDFNIGESCSDDLLHSPLSVHQSLYMQTDLARGMHILSIHFLLYHLSSNPCSSPLLRGRGSFCQVYPL